MSQPPNVRLTNPDEMIEAHNALSAHAFTCYEKFAATYRECRDEGYSWAASYDRAVRAHNGAVEWACQNVGLD